MKDKVSRLCRKLDLTPDELARHLGVNRQAVMNWLSGRVRESSKSPLIDSALQALDEGFGKQFVMEYVLVDGPLRFSAIQKHLSRSQKGPNGTGEESSQPASAGTGKEGETALPTVSPEDDGKKLLSDMELASLEAYTKGHYIQSALILFQAIETLLRIVIRTHGQARGIPDKVLLEAADKEQSFLRLTLHLDLVFPKNEYTEKLRILNRMRNDTMHRLFFEFESRDEMEERLKEFCQEARNLRDSLSDEVHRSLQEMLKKHGRRVSSGGQRK
ncbi:MAG TPA: hypothetical protein VLV83_15125 [Acidobacteriota bacterium]|nr:hypothetical protein [Acidobacteriota bacterium]